MEVILKTTDISVVTFVEMLFSSEGIPFHVLDRNMSVLEGSINIFPISVMVLDSDYDVARDILEDNGISTT